MSEKNLERRSSLTEAKMFVDDSVPDDVYNRDGVQYCLLSENPDSAGCLYLFMIDEDNDDILVSNVCAFPSSSCSVEDYELMSQFSIGGFEDEDGYLLIS